VPVELYSATEAHEPAFHQFEEGTSDRIRYRRVNERTGDEVDYSDIAKGADVGGGNYVVLDQDELARSGRTAIASFVMRAKELAAVRADGVLLVLETLFFADEVRDPHSEPRRRE